MNRALSSWSPRVRPLLYDSLQQDVGCQDVRYGTKVFASLPFERICIIEHTQDPLSVFNRPDTVSYTIGPLNTGDPLPWSTIWAAWVSSEGVRIAKLPSIALPSNDTGNPSTFYPDTKPENLSIGFTTLAQVAIAIQKTPSSIEIKWLKSRDGTNLQTVAFPGVSPVLQSNALLQYGIDNSINDLVLYYLRPEVSGTIYARFERENFGTEHAVNTSLQADIRRLIASDLQGNKHVLFGRDIFGRDITLYTRDYIILAGGDKNTLALEIVAGSYTRSAILRTVPGDKTKLALSIVGGKVSKPIQEPPILSGDANKLAVSIVAGQYT